MTKYIIFVLLILFVTIPTLKADVKKWQLEQVGFLNIDRNEKDYGGFSGLVISNEGTEALVVTDKSFFFVLELRRDENDILTGYAVIRKGRILSSKGEHLNGRNTDSESIVIDENNNYYISFESNHRIMMHAEVGGKGVFVPKHPMFRKLSVNKGIEALAIDADNRLIAIPEKPPLGISDIPIFRLQNDKWEIIKNVKINDNFLITDAEILPQGLLLTLERKFSWTQGFKTRFRLISLDKFDNTEPITVFTSTANQFDNLEGLTLWRDKKGEIRILTVSDDNFHPLQKSEIREFFLKYE
ncbi:MAG: esterase-like activity of phytase family protein [Paracoccaceae bacterium]